VIALSQEKKSEPACAICGTTHSRELYTAQDRLRNSAQAFVIAECPGCSVVRTLPALSSEELATYYPQDYWAESDEPSIDWIKSSQREKTDFLTSCGLMEGRILDVGCGAGFFLRALDPNKWERWGVEPGRNAASAATRAIGEDRLSCGDLLGASFESAKFDVVTLWSSLEHTSDPPAEVREVRRILKPGGTLIVQVPNIASYQARIFRGDWFALDAPRHRYHFSETTLKRVLVESALQPYRVTFRSRSHNSHSLRQSLKTRLLKIRPRAAGKGVFLLTIPFIKPCDSLLSLFSTGATITLAARAC
jgi:2-polyprenyl-3-methyl-5-hydroxy-6-metoxy-1,4-benzoquinol methylase